MKLNSFCAGVCLLMSAAVQPMHAVPLDTWHPRNMSLTAERLNAVAHGQGRFVAVGDHGVTLASSDGIDWALSSTGSSERLNTIAYGQGRFVAGGDAGSFFWSDDGSSWVRATSPAKTNYDVTAIGFGSTAGFPNGLFVSMASASSAVAGSARTITLTSPDGVTWTTNAGRSDAAAAPGYSSIVFGNNRFVAARVVNPLSLARTVTSTDGTNWFFASGSWSGALTFGNGLFVLAQVFQSESGGIKLLSNTSADGSEWPAYSFGGFNAPSSACFGGNRFVAVAGQGFVASSVDGTNWTTHLVRTDAALRGVVYGDGLYVAVGEAGAIFTSPDGSTWQQRSRSGGLNLFAAAPFGDGFIAVGNGGALAWSADGMDWSSTNSPSTNALRSIINAGGKLVAVGDEGSIVVGTAPGDLALMNSGVSSSLQGVAHDGNRFVAVGQSGLVLTSINAVDWVPAVSPTTNNLYAIVSGGGKFVAAGDLGTILTSSDGLTWVVRPSGTTRSFSDVVFGRGVYVAAAFQNSMGTGPCVVSSETGLEWSSPSNSVASSARRIAHGNGFFVIPFQTDASWVSEDGIAWKTVHTGAVSPFLQPALAYNNGTFISAGQFGLVFQSDAVIRLQYLSGPPAQIAVEGPKGKTYRIESLEEGAGSLIWQEVGTISSSPYTFVDPQPPTLTKRLYRAVLLP